MRKKNLSKDYFSPSGKSLNKRLAENGLRATSQRQHVYDVLLAQRDHPSAEEVFMRAKQSKPEISMATVYNSLDALVKCGVVRHVNVDRGATLFCSNMSEHAHFCCDDCGKVFDVNLKNSPQVPEVDVPSEFQVRKIDIALHGRCTGKCSDCGRKEAVDTIDEFVASDYKYGFVTDIESESLEPGLGEDVVRFISAKKNEPEWMLEWRLKAFRHWEKLECPTWPHVKYPPVNFQGISYYSAPKKKGDGPKSLDEVDPKLLETYEKLGVPLHERARLAGVAVDAVFDSESIGTTFKADLAKAGVIFCSMSEAVQEHPELIRKYLGTVVPFTSPRARAARWS